MLFRYGVKMARDTTTLNLRISTSLKERAQVVAKADHRSLTSLIEKLLDDCATAFERAKAAERRK